MGYSSFMSRAAPFLAGAALLLASPPVLATEPSPDRGAYLFHLSGCAGCHTDEKNNGAPLAGGRELKTPFGIFYSPNITPDTVYGIGAWTDEDFLNAMRKGIAPDGRHYYPSFPYTAYTKMRNEDIADLKAYLFTQPAHATSNRNHELSFPFNLRYLMRVWKILFLNEGPVANDPARDAQWHRGRYLVDALGHCGECHTPRNALGTLDQARYMAGSAQGIKGEQMPNITPDLQSGIGKWTDGDFQMLLSIGMLPDGDFVGGGMGTVVTHITSHLNKDDQAAMIGYLRTIPPIHTPALKAKKSKNSASAW